MVRKFGNLLLIPNQAAKGNYLKSISSLTKRCTLVVSGPGIGSAISTLVNQILTLKQSDVAADTSALEREIDVLVYGLYGLTAEVAMVEGKG
jgi:hypothetical protein